MVKSDQKNLIAHALDDLYMRKLLVQKSIDVPSTWIKYCIDKTDAKKFDKKCQHFEINRALSFLPLSRL